MSRTQIYLPKTQKDEVKKIALKEGTTISHVIRVFVEQGLRSLRMEKSTKRHRSLLDVLEAVKRLKEKGPKDLAANVDKYLYRGKK